MAPGRPNGVLPGKFRQLDSGITCFLVKLLLSRDQIPGT